MCLASFFVLSFSSVTKNSLSELKWHLFNNLFYVALMLKHRKHMTYFQNTVIIFIALYHLSHLDTDVSLGVSIDF
jgi:hypothetical protein